MSYAKEYDDAISRLNAPERTPLPYAPIPYGPVPNKCNYANWNRIMLETRQGNLPKYSIMQRCEFDKQNIWSGSPVNSNYYVYKLDPSFVFAKGDRKSIAIREVNVHPPLTANEKFVGRFTNSFTFFTQDNKAFVENQIETTFESEMNVDYDTTISSMAKKVQEAYVETFSRLKDQNYDPATDPDGFGAYTLMDLLSSVQTATTKKSLFVYLNFKPTYRLNRGRSHFQADEQMLIIPPSFANYLNHNAYRIYSRGNQINVKVDENGDTYDEILIKYQFANKPINFKYGSLCSDINPWTAKNVISSYSFTSDALNKVFPFNGNDEIRFWFLDVEGNPVKYDYARGNIDLELIIDNTNTYALET